MIEKINDTKNNRNNIAIEKETKKWREIDNVGQWDAKWMLD